MAPEVTKIIFGTKQLSNRARANRVEVEFRTQCSGTYHQAAKALQKMISPSLWKSSTQGSFISAGKIRLQREHTPCLHHS